MDVRKNVTVHFQSAAILSNLDKSIQLINEKVLNGFDKKNDSSKKVYSEICETINQFFSMVTQLVQSPTDIENIFDKYKNKLSTLSHYNGLTKYEREMIISLIDLYKVLAKLRFYLFKLSNFDEKFISIKDTSITAIIENASKKITEVEKSDYLVSEFEKQVAIIEKHTDTILSENDIKKNYLAVLNKNADQFIQSQTIKQAQIQEEFQRLSEIFSNFPENIIQHNKLLEEYKNRKVFAPIYQNIDNLKSALMHINKENVLEFEDLFLFDMHPKNDSTKKPIMHTEILDIQENQILDNEEGVDQTNDGKLKAKSFLNQLRRIKRHVRHSIRDIENEEKIFLENRCKLEVQSKNLFKQSDMINQLLNSIDLQMANLRNINITKPSSSQFNLNDISLFSELLKSCASVNQIVSMLSNLESQLKRPIENIRTLALSINELAPLQFIAKLQSEQNFRVEIELLQNKVKEVIKQCNNQYSTIYAYVDNNLQSAWKEAEQVINLITAKDDLSIFTELIRLQDYLKNHTVRKELEIINASLNDYVKILENLLNKASQLREQLACVQDTYEKITDAFRKSITKSLNEACIQAEKNLSNIVKDKLENPLVQLRSEVMNRLSQSVLPSISNEKVEFYDRNEAKMMQKKIANIHELYSEKLILLTTVKNKRESITNQIKFAGKEKIKTKINEKKPSPVRQELNEISYLIDNNGRKKPGFFKRHKTKILTSILVSSFAGIEVGLVLGYEMGVAGAPFTFGLSIPLCTFIGGLLGLVSGAIVGLVTGILSGKMADVCHRSPIDNLNDQDVPLESVVKKDFPLIKKLSVNNTKDIHSALGGLERKKSILDVNHEEDTVYTLFPRQASLDKTGPTVNNMTPYRSKM